MYIFDLQHISSWTRQISEVQWLLYWGPQVDRVSPSTPDGDPGIWIFSLKHLFHEFNDTCFWTAAALPQVAGASHPQLCAPRTRKTQLLRLLTGGQAERKLTFRKIASSYISCLATPTNTHTLHPYFNKLKRGNYMETEFPHKYLSNTIIISKKRKRKTIQHDTFTHTLRTCCSEAPKLC